MGIAEILIILLMLFLNGIFAAYELAITTVNLGRIKLLSEQKKKGAHSALLMKTRMGASLAVVQIGITLVGAIAAAIGGAEAGESISTAIRSSFPVSRTVSEAIAIAIVVIPLSSVTIVIGELVPKTLAIKNNEKVCLILSPVMRSFAFIVYPSILLFEWLTKKIVIIFEEGIIPDSARVEPGITELAAYARALRTSRVIDSKQERIIIGASNFERISVREIVIPAEEIVTLFVDGDLTDHIVTVHLEGYTRFPVTEIRSDPQSIIGYVNIKELIFLAKTHPANPNLREILRPVISFYSDTSIGEAFSRMMGEHFHLALVRDYSNNILGMITLEDILEEVVGDIQDEFDRLPRYISSRGRQFVVGGGVLLSTLFSKINYSGPVSKEMPSTTLSEWVTKNHSTKVSGGDLIIINNIEILVRKVRRNHILEAIVSSKSQTS